MDAIRKRRAEQKAEAGANVSMADGVNDQIYGINRKVIYVVVGTLVVAFLSFS